MVTTATQANNVQVKTFFIIIAKGLFVLPFAAFGLLHFGPLEFSLAYVPTWLPAPALWIYALGLCLIAFSVSAIIQKLDGLASFLLTALLLIFVTLVHIPTAASGDFTGLISVLRDSAMAGAALLYGLYIAKDKRFTRLN